MSLLYSGIQDDSLWAEDSWTNKTVYSWTRRSGIESWFVVGLGGIMLVVYICERSNAFIDPADVCVCRRDGRMNIR